jgi:hypothetical protein
MISVVLYGRNDSYGYNLHKRAALSLNCIAELLHGPEDEILFVDYNTPNDFPVFLEAIQDTLTPKARAITRCLRVRPHIHQLFAHRTHLVALESIARNVGVRRSNPANRWILSTNTDMIFVPHNKPSLTEIAAELPDGFYHAPRMEIPETLWESTDRTKPAEIIQTIRRWGDSLYLNEIVYGSKTILYDGPGDFQLCLRRDMFAIQGFHEDMLLGWHVDSNLAARLSLIHGPVGDLGEEVWGYHCDHTRQITPMHGHNRLENDWVTYGERVKRPDLPQHAESWGCAGHEIEEVRVDGKSVAGYIATLERVIGQPLAATLTASTADTAADVDGYDPGHVLPFLIDLFATERRDFRLAWWGLQPALLGLFARAWAGSGFSEPILCDEALRERLAALPDGAVRFAPAESCRELVDAFLFDVTLALDGAKDDSEAPDVQVREDLVVGPFLAAVAADRSRLGTGAPLRRFIAIGAINNRFERLMRSHVGTGQTPYSTRLRHGFVLAEQAGPFPVLKEMSLRDAGERPYKTIETITGVGGAVVSGPWRYLDPGYYIARLRITPARDIQSSTVIGLFQRFKRGILLQTVPLRVASRESVTIPLWFETPRADTAVLPEVYDFSISAGGVHDFTVDDLTIERLAEPPSEQDWLRGQVEPFADLGDWLPLMEFEEPIRYAGASVRIAAGLSGYLVKGPYWPLPTGIFEITMEVSCDAAAGEAVLFLLEMTIDTELRLSRPIRAGDVIDGKVKATFHVRQGRSIRDLRLVELRIGATGAGGFEIHGLRVRKVHEAATECANWLSGISPTASARMSGDGLRHLPGDERYLTRGPYWPLEPGAYEVSLQWSQEQSLDASVGTLDIVRDGEDLASHPLPARGAHAGPFTFPFVVPAPAAGRHDMIEVRIGAHQPVPFTVRSVAIRRLGDHAADIPNWLPALNLGPAGERQAEVIAARPGVEGYVVTGPYYPLQPGRYKLVVGVGLTALPRSRRPLAVIECLVDGELAGSAPLHPHNAVIGRRAVPFVVEKAGKVELRIQSTGVAPFLLKSMRLELVR